jgi:hypothetical protein
MDVSQPLEGLRVDHHLLGGIEGNEVVDGVPDLGVFLGHWQGIQALPALGNWCDPSSAWVHLSAAPPHGASFYTNICSHNSRVTGGSDRNAGETIRRRRHPYELVLNPEQAELPEDLPTPHPEPGRGQFLPRLGYGQQGLVALLGARGIRTTVAPLYFLRDNPELTLIPSGGRMGAVLDPCTQLRQVAWAERPSAFRALSFGNDPEPYEPDSARLTDEDLLHLGVDPIDEARGRGGTLLLTTFHRAGGAGTRGRDIELLLAELGIAHFLAEGIRESPPFAAVDVSREIYAAVAVHVRDLSSPVARASLAEAYLALDPDGFWVKIEGFHERSSPEQIRNGASFLSALREGGKTVVSCGSGQLHLGLLAEDFSASIGLAENERFRVPAPWRKANKEGERRGRRRMAYHPKFHRSFRVDTEDALKAFATAPCECELHVSSAPPDGGKVAQHAAILRTDQAREALGGEREDRREWVLASSTMASWAAADADLPPEKFSATKSYEALFAGLDAGRQVAAGEQADF